MYFKLARSNIRKSYKDYTIYFLTLILGVCIFYSFNAMDSQKVVIAIKSLNTDYTSKLTEVISIVSILVSVILGCLIVYANNFLIKKRKKELGIYMTLGMGKRRVSRILVTETFLVGCISLVVGIILGMATSQFLSAFTLKLFDVGMDEYRFAVSISAIGKTALYFGIIFLLVIIFNTFVISKYKVIDLLTAGRKNEDIKFKKSFIYLLSFLLSVVLLSFSYKSILKIGLNSREPMLIPSLVIAIIGTVLFFFSLAGVILYIVNKNRKAYFKGLNIFLLKQIISKVNTNFISMSLICLMLFITIVVLSTGISVKKDTEEGMARETPFDASIIVNNDDSGDILEDVLHKIDFKTSENEKYSVHNEYTLGVKVEDLLSTKDEDGEVTFIKISDYNEMLKIRGKEKISLNKDEVLLMSNYNVLANPVNERLKSDKKVNIKGKEYLVKNDKLIDENLATYLISDNYLTVVINDNFLSDYKKIERSVLNIIYSNDNREENNMKYDEIWNNFLNGRYKDLNIPHISAYSKDKLYSHSKEGTTSILFAAIYLGLIFLITSMAVLALQQLSEASDSIEKYRALKRIGASKKMIDKAIFIQTLIYFSIPMFLALIHSVIGIIVINGEIGKFNNIDIRFPALITALIFVIVYSVYFYTTYTGYKNIVKNNI